MCFDTVKSKISQNAVIPAKKYGFTKQKHIRGDKTLKCCKTKLTIKNLKAKASCRRPPKYKLTKNDQTYQN